MATSKQTNPHRLETLVEAALAKAEAETPAGRA
jgi:hypothetical protein